MAVSRANQANSSASHVSGNGYSMVRARMDTVTGACLSLFLAPFFFIIKAYERYPEAISGIDILLLIVKYTLFGAVAAWLLCFIIPSFRKAALFVLLLVVVQFGFGSFHDSLKGIAGGATIARYVVMLPCLLILFAWLFWTLLKSKKTFKTPTRYFNLLFFILALPELFFLGMKKRPGADPLQGALTVCASCAKPDIYLCVLDLSLIHI